MRDITHDPTASTAALLVDFEKFNAPTTKWHNVNFMELVRHKKMGRADSVRVIYETDGGHFNIWVCPEHGGYAERKAQKWVAEHFPDYYDDMNTTEILEVVHDIQQPLSICVKSAGQYPNITKFDFEECRGESLAPF